MDEYFNTLRFMVTKSMISKVCFMCLRFSAIGRWKWPKALVSNAFGIKLLVLAA